MSIDMFALAWKIAFPGKPLKKLVLLCLADHHNDEIGFAWPSYKTIAGRCGMSRRTVVSIIADLESDGFIRRQERHGNGNLNTSNAYYLNEALMKSAAAVAEKEAPHDGDRPSPSEPTIVIDLHHNGDPAAPPMVIDVHQDGDRRAPNPLSNLLIEPLEEPLSAAAAAPAAPPPPAVAAAADPLAPLLDWIGFDDALTDKERQTLDPTTLLAWAYWVKLKQAENASRVYNPVGLVRDQWRKGKQPRADLLLLARGWFRLDDDGRARLLGRIEWIGEFTAHDPAVPLDAEFPNLPLSTAAAVYAATAGQLAPPGLSPAAPIAPPAPLEPAPPPPAPSPPAAGQSPIWKTALGDLQYQLDHAPFNAWLRGTTAAETADGLTVYVASDHALDWLRGRLHPLIERAVASAAGRPLAIHYEARP